MYGYDFKGVICLVIDGIIDEVQEIFGEIVDLQVFDVVLFVVVQVVEYYEIICYGIFVVWVK